MSPPDPTSCSGPSAATPRPTSPPDFDTLFRTEFPRVARTVHHIVGDRRQADEVTQDAFLELLRHWPKVSGYDRPELWVRRVAIRKAQRERHRTWRRTELERVGGRAARARTPDAGARGAPRRAGARAQAARDRRALLLRGPADGRDRRDRGLFGVDGLEPAAARTPPTGGHAGRGGDRRCRLTNGSGRRSAESDETWDAATEAALRAVGRRHARGLALRRGAAVGSLAAAVAVGAVLVGSDRLGSESAPDPIGPPTPPSQAEPSGPNRSALEGRWRTALLDEDDLRAALEGSGNGQYADQVLPSLPPGAVPAGLAGHVRDRRAAPGVRGRLRGARQDRARRRRRAGDRVPAVRRRGHGPPASSSRGTSSGCRSSRRPRACRTAFPARSGSGCSTTRSRSPDAEGRSGRAGADRGPRRLRSPAPSPVPSGVAPGAAGPSSSARAATAEHDPGRRPA